MKSDHLIFKDTERIIRRLSLLRVGKWKINSTIIPSKCCSYSFYSLKIKKSFDTTAKCGEYDVLSGKSPDCRSICSLYPILAGRSGCLRSGSDPSVPAQIHPGARVLCARFGKCSLLMISMKVSSSASSPSLEESISYSSPYFFAKRALAGTC
jgi:hypothetical protein